MQEAFQDPNFDNFKYLEQDPTLLESPEDNEMIMVEELPDGSSVFDFKENLQQIVQQEEDDFYGDISSKIDDGKLNGIASQLLDGIEQDKQSREEWQQAYLKGMKYLGFK